MAVSLATVGQHVQEREQLDKVSSSKMNSAVVLTLSFEKLKRLVNLLGDELADSGEQRQSACEKNIPCFFELIIC